MNKSVKKVFPILLITVFLISLIGIFTVEATPINFIYTVAGGTAGYGAQLHDWGGASRQNGLQSFTVSTSGYLQSITIEVYQSGAGTANAYLFASLWDAPSGSTHQPVAGNVSELRAADENYNSTAFIEQASNYPLAHTTAAGVRANVIFTFSGDTQLVAGHWYGLVVGIASNESALLIWTPGGGDTNVYSQSYITQGTGWTTASGGYNQFLIVTGDTAAPTVPTFSLSDQYNFYDEDTLVQLTGVQNTTVPWIIDYNVTQGETYDFAGIVFNNSIPTGISGTLEIWRTALYNGTADLNPVTSSYNSVYNNMNAELNQYPPNGTGYIYHDTVNVTDGTAYFDVDPIYTYGSQVSYQGYLLYYNITGNGDDPYEGWLMHHWIIGAYDPVYLAGGLPTAAPTATPDEVGNYIPDPANGAASAIVNYLAALLIILLPAGVLGVLFKFGAWGFITGMAIGSGIGYLMLFDVNGNHVVPLWLVFLIVIGSVGMLMRGYIGKGGESDQ